MIFCADTKNLLFMSVFVVLCELSEKLSPTQTQSIEWERDLLNGFVCLLYLTYWLSWFEAWIMSSAISFSFSSRFRHSGILTQMIFALKIFPYLTCVLFLKVFFIKIRKKFVLYKRLSMRLWFGFIFAGWVILFLVDFIDWICEKWKREVAEIFQWEVFPWMSYISYFW